MTRRPGRPRRPAALLGAGLALALVAAACSDRGSDDGPAATSSTSTTVGAADGAPDLDAVDLALEEVAVVDTPSALVDRPGSLDLYVAEQGGAVRRIAVTEDADGERTERLVREPVIDLSDRIVSGGEQGLLGLEFSSDGRRLYLYATIAPDGDNWVGAVDLGEGTTADADDVRTVLTVEDHYPNHNGGQLALGPDGFLYIGLGDGGGAGDPDGNGQDTGTLLGKVLRIDPDSGAGDEPYAIPAGNPFEAGGGEPEIWITGARNPWRFSFDREQGDLWIGDVGQGAWEEVDRLPATDGIDAGRGANLGWNRMEGSHPYEGGTPPPGHVGPVYEYDHGDGGCSVIGGYVYRGEAIPGLVGAYLFADYCRAGLDGLVPGTQTTRHWDLRVEQVQSFGEDADGELYVLTADGDVLRIVADP